MESDISKFGPVLSVIKNVREGTTNKWLSHFGDAHGALSFRFSV